jgi:hypothetical protein
LSTLFTTNIGGIQIFSEGTEVVSIPAYDPGFRGTNTNTLNFTSVAANAKLDYFSPNSDWTLQEHSTNVEEWHSQSVFKVTLQVKRQPLYYTVIVTENPTRSPDSTGNKKTRGFKTAKSSVGMTTITV